MITRLYVDNYRCLSNFEVRFDRAEVLVGDNGTGKSTALRVVDLLRRLATDPLLDLAEHLGPDSTTRWDTRSAQRFELDLSIDSSRYRYAVGVDEARPGGPPRIVSEAVLRDGQPLFTRDLERVRFHRSASAVEFDLPVGSHHGFFAFLDPQPGADELTRVRDALSRIVVLALDPRHMEAESTSEAARLSVDGSNFSAWYRGFSSAHLGSQAALFAALAEPVPGLSGLQFESLGRIKRLVARFAHRSTRYALGFDELSDGQRALVVLYALSAQMQDEPMMLFIDEPAAHLALGELQPWVVDAVEAVAERGQLVLASHHPDLIDYLAARKATLFTRDSGGPVKTELLTVDRDAGLSASDVIRMRLYRDE